MKNTIDLRDWTPIPLDVLFTFSPEKDVKYELLSCEDKNKMVKVVSSESEEIKRYPLHFLKYCIHIGYFTHYRVI